MIGYTLLKIRRLLISQVHAYAPTWRACGAGADDASTRPAVTESVNV
jgi:hypothetical protein